MLTRGDDYPIHQTPEPVAFAGSDRNFYDRYFFNGYSPDLSLFFAAALGVYPQLDVIDAAFCVLVEGKQHNVRASLRLDSERMNLKVGPIEVRVIDPLRQLGVRVGDNDAGVRADLVFDAGKLWNRRAVIDRAGRASTEFEQPRFTLRYRPGARRIQHAAIAFDEETALAVEPAGAHFYMSGLGYMHPTWGHGRDHGEFETACDVIVAASIDDNAPGQLHIQALARATLTDHGKSFAGAGVLEQLLIGPHAPSGFTSMLDPAP